MFYLIIFLAALGALSFFWKLFAIVRSPSGATLNDTGDLFCDAGLTGFAIGCGLMLYPQTHSWSMAPGVAVIGCGVLAALTGVALKTRAQRTDWKNPEISAASLAERKILADRVLSSIGQNPAVAVASSAKFKHQKFSQLFFIPFIMFGAFFVFIGARELARSYSSTHWPRTDGVITSASIERRQASGRHHHGYVYTAKIAYEYKVAGAPYTGTRIRFGMTDSSAENAQAFVNLYPPGRQVAVFYSPADPAQTVLQTGIFGGVWLELGLGALFMASGVGALFIRRKMPS